jgi:hypothetical protein
MVKEIYAPIVTVQDSTYIMDYVNNKWVTFNADMNVSKVDSIGFDFLPFQAPRCFVSEEQDALYIASQDNGITTISEIAVSDCSVLKSFTIPHNFPENITVNGGYVYYVHRDPKNRLNRFLSRLRL